jgi:broad specificity phosphatase PhoE
MRIFLIRHGEVVGGRDRVYGQTDLPLSELGVRHAQAAANYLRRYHIDAVYSSDLSRARDGAKLIAEGRGPHAEPMPVREDVRFREMSMGELEGLRRADGIARYPELGRLRYHDLADARFPGGESGAEVQARVTEGFEALVAAHDDGDTLALVAHNTVCRILLGRVLGLGLRESLMNFAQPYGCVSLIHVPKAGGKLFADHADPTAGDVPRVEFMGLAPDLPETPDASASRGPPGPH